jgi:chemotaxis signal transduction protein
MADPQTATTTPTPGAAASPRSDYCIFERDGRRFALSTTLAKEVLEARPFTPVPYAPPDLLGAFNLRGEVIPLVNLDRFLEVTGRPVARGDTLLMLSHGDLTMAAVVDQVVVIKHVSPWEIRRAKLDPSVTNTLARGLIGRDHEQAMVLDGERMIAAVIEQIAAGLRGTRGKASGATPVHVAAPGGSAAAETSAQAGAASQGAYGAAANGAAGPQGSRPDGEPPVGGR